MNTVVTSKEQILQTSRELIRQQGWSTVSIRSVAAACGVSVGSIYNYFDSKAELVGATVESVWCEIFHLPDHEAVFRDTEACVTWMYEPHGVWLPAVSGIFHPAFPGIHAGRKIRWKTADAARPGSISWTDCVWS